MPGTVSNCHIRVHLCVIYVLMANPNYQDLNPAVQTTPFVSSGKYLVTLSCLPGCLICRDPEHQLAKTFPGGC